MKCNCTGCKNRVLQKVRAAHGNTEFYVCPEHTPIEPGQIKSTPTTAAGITKSWYTLVKDLTPILEYDPLTSVQAFSYLQVAQADLTLPPHIAEHLTGAPTPNGICCAYAAHYARKVDGQPTPRNCGHLFGALRAIADNGHRIEGVTDIDRRFIEFYREAF